MTTTTPTTPTTYPYSQTTFTNASPASFTTPSAIPSMFPWGAIPSFACTAPSSSPSASPNGPLQLPSSDSGSCAISNVDSVNTHAFWDMYECCKSGKMSTIGSPLPCTAVCYTNDDQSFLELGKCLSERVGMVVCSPPVGQRGEAKSESSSASSARSSVSNGSAVSSSASASKTEVSGVTGQASRTATATTTVTEETGAANALVGGHSGVSKAGLAIFGLVAFTSAVGMLL